MAVRAKRTPASYVLRTRPAIPLAIIQTCPRPLHISTVVKIFKFASFVTEGPLSHEWDDPRDGGARIARKSEIRVWRDSVRDWSHGFRIERKRRTLKQRLGMAWGRPIVGRAEAGCRSPSAIGTYLQRTDDRPPPGHAWQGVSPTSEARPRANLSGRASKSELTEMAEHEDAFGAV